MKLLSIRTLITALILLVVTGTVIQIQVSRNMFQPVDVELFQLEINRQLKVADQLVASHKNLNDSGFQQLLEQKQHLKSSAEFYFYEDNSLVNWSSGNYTFDFNELSKKTTWFYSRQTNIHGLFKWFAQSDRQALLVLIPLKYAYPYENQFLINHFNPVFKVSSDADLSDKAFINSTAIVDSENNYLLDISTEVPVSADSLLKIAGFVVFLLAFITYLLLYFKLTYHPGKIHFTRFGLITLTFLFILLVLCWLDLPSVLFNNFLFSPQHFTVNQLLKTYTHLTVLLIFTVLALYCFSLQFKLTKYKSVAVIMTLLYYVLLVLLIKSIIYHSSSNFNVYLLNEFTFINGWAHVLLLVALAGGYLMLSLSFPDFFRLKFPVAGAYIIIATLLSLGLAHHLNQTKKFSQFRVLAENIKMNGTSIKDPATELLLEELDYKILSDSTINNYKLPNDSIIYLLEYIESRHLALFKNKYDIKLSLVNLQLSEQNDYVQLMKNIGNRVGESAFYSLPASLYESSYAGIISLSADDTQQSSALLIEFQNNRNFRSYSFPDLLTKATTSTLPHNEISVASYENNKLTYSDLLYEWPESSENFDLNKNSFTKIKLPAGTFYILQSDQQLIGIHELKAASQFDKLFYYILITAMYMAIISLLLTLHHYVYSHKRMTIGLTGKFQFVFILLLMVSFVSTLIFSTNYFRKNYEKEQLQLTNNKKHYIQSSLQETFFWVNDLASVSKDQLNLILQELAYRFQTDIHIYNLNGELAGSSINLIFSKQLTSPLIAPEIILNKEKNGYRYEKIGQLSYLTGYSELLNGDYLQIGYIAVPQFFSQSDINLKINQFSIALFQIFTLIIILSILLVLFAGNKLATPLRLLEEKLKSMKLTGSNARIEYRAADEIGQLVEQYNKTVDELEKSTQMLIQSEREIAWRTMARQIAHEINNPLTPMKLTIQQMQRLRDHEDEQFTEYFNKTTKTLVEQIDNLSRIAGTFSQFARLPDTQLQRIDIAERLFTTIGLFRHNAEEVEISHTGPTSGIYTMGDAEQFSRVFINLLKNAVQAIPSDRNGKIDVSIITENTTVIIDIADNGVGISEETEKNIFKPNFTTKSSGMGLGLSISKAIVEHAGGTLRFRSQPDSGSIFTIHLPLMQ